MKLSELKRVVDFSVGLWRDEKDPEVLITLANNSIGGRAATSVQHVGMGFDWESGQFRIEPEQRLYREGRTLEDPIKTIAFKYIYDKKVRVIHHCPKCEAVVQKGAKFCSQCGQHISINSEVSYSHDYRTK